MNSTHSVRIDIVVNSLGIGGAERHSTALADALHDQGHVVRLIALSTTAGSRRQTDTRAIAEAIELPRRGPWDWRALGRYRRLVRADPPDLTVTVNQYPLAFSWAATRFMRHAPVLQIMHTIELPDEDTVLKRWLYPRLLRVPAAVAYVCELQRQHWRRAGVRARPDHCVHNGVDAHRFQPLPAAIVATTRADLGWSPDDFVIGLCAVLRPEKRHDLLLQALALLWKRGEPTYALLIGDGPQSKPIAAMALSLNLGHAVHITGYQRDVVPYMAACDAMCLVSDHETFSLAVLEAMAMGKAVIATRTGGVEEQITHGDNGLIVPCGDAQALAEAISRLRQQPLRETLGQRAADTVRAHFTASHMHAHYARIVQELTHEATANGAAS